MDGPVPEVSLPLHPMDPNSVLFKELLSSTPSEAVSDPMVPGPGMHLRAVELFAGVGGFHRALERAGIEIIWANQWEPGRRTQHAFECYVRRFPHTQASNSDIATVESKEIPSHDLLVGGFPCQDYSVATSQAEGLHGKKGVLWWEIFRLLQKRRPGYVLLENVDRLLKSPTKQRGRDFGVMLQCLAALGYRAEWRVLNAADYGAPQKRRRLFIAAAHKKTPLGAMMAEAEHRRRWLKRQGFFAKAFPVLPDQVAALAPESPTVTLSRDLQGLSDQFAFPFENAGLMVDRRVWTYPVAPKGEPIVPLRTVLESRVPEQYYIPVESLAKWAYLKGAKAEKRKASNGHVYHYTEGPIPFPDNLDRPSRTLITSEGGTSPSRFKHIIKDPETGRMRVLTPTECERLNQFPEGWTAGMPENWRYFCMGNALVVGLIERMAAELVRRVGAAKVVEPRAPAALARVH